MEVTEKTVQRWEGGESDPLPTHLRGLAALSGRPVEWIRGVDPPSAADVFLKGQTVEHELRRIAGLLHALAERSDCSTELAARLRERGRELLDDAQSLEQR
jgi:hypothetical protein